MKTQPWLTEALAAETDDCIIWPFSVSSSGYGDFRRAGRHWSAHVYVCTVAHGEAPAERMDAAHSCGTKLCCNKRHLRWATRRANHADKRAHGRHVFGEAHPDALLTEAKVREIRASKASGASMARKFGVAPNTIYAVRQRRSWGHV